MKTNPVFKSLIKTLLIAFLSLFGVSVSAQNIIQMEYFFDTDPGAGNGLPISIPSSPDSVTSVNIISTLGLAPGQHFLFVRALQAGGVWSLYESRAFFIKPPVSLAEYFFDTDPGAGNGTPLSIVAGIDSTVINASISSVGLGPGRHFLFIRTRANAQEPWSLHAPLEFYINNAPLLAEYFFDSDPGFGNGIALTGFNGTDSSQLVTSVSTTGLTSGYHVLFIRTRDQAGNWSMYAPREFFIKQPMVAAEYFFDTDPGPGFGLSLPVIPGPDSSLVNFSFITTGVPSGNHVLFVRTKDASGHWSFYEPREFYVRPSIVAAEYFIDADPGLGNGTALTVGIPSDSVIFNAVVTTPALSMGTHHLFVRTRDQSGKWSLFEHVEFTTGSPLPVEWLSFEAVRKDNDALLTWTTASEHNCDLFEVERMIPGTNPVFLKIGEVKGNGTSSILHAYHFTDLSVPAPGVCYYRIRQVDYNGDYSFSETRTLNFQDGMHAPLSVSVYPNPSKDRFRLEANENAGSVDMVDILTLSGQQVSSLKDVSFPYTFGDNLEAGTYIVRIHAGGETKCFRIVKAE